MSVSRSFAAILLMLFTCVPAMLAATQTQEAEVKLYTPYMKVSVIPGESIDYGISIINNSKEIKNVDISIYGIPAGWNYDVKSGAYNIRQISVLPDGKENIDLKVAVPLKVNKGTYRFQVVAGDFGALPLTVIVSEQGTYKTEFTTTQSNMEGASNTTFNFQTTLHNRTAEMQHYSLASGAPPGWNVVFKPNYRQATSADVEANSNVEVTIEVDPPDQAAAGTYKIPVRAFTNTTSATLDLEVVITGTFSMVLTTPAGLLSTSITAGEEKTIDMIVTNTGSAAIKNIKLNYNAPINWTVAFDPKEIATLEPGATSRVLAKITAYKKAIPGDYIANFDAATITGTTSKVAYRITVKTPLIWGWAGILIIFLALGSIYYLFRRYGRR